MLLAQYRFAVSVTLGVFTLFAATLCVNVSLVG